MIDKANDIKALLEQTGDRLHDCRSSLHSILTRDLNGILIVDKGWKVLYANPAAEVFFNAKEQGLLGKPFKFPIAPGESKELNLRTRDGETVAAEMWMMDIEWEGKPAIFISIHDISERKRNDYERRKMYQAMMQSPSMVMITDSMGLIENVNPRFTEVTGYEAADVIGKNPRFLHGQTPPERYRELWGALTTGKEWRGEFINRKKSGEFYTEQASIAPVTNFDGTITHFIAVKEDITTRKQAEEAVAISETRYRRLFETAKDGILMLDADTGQITEVNPFLVEVLGYTSGELLGKKLWEIGSFKDIAASRSAFSELQQKEYIRYEDLPIETKGGQRINVEFVSNVYLVGSQKVIQCNIRNINERKQAEEAVAISETRYRRLFETAKDGILMLDADTGQITEVNPFLVEVLGYTSGELLGKKLWEIGSFKDIAASRSAFSELQQKEYIRYEDLPIETKEGQRINVEFVSNVYLVGSQKVIQCNIRNINIRKQVEEERELALLQLEAVLENINEGVVIADLEGNVLAMNKVALALYEYESIRQLSKYLDTFDWFDLNGRPMTFEEWPLTRAIHGERFVDYEVRLRRKDTGREWVASYTGTPVFNKAGDAILAVITLRDITEKNRLGEELKISETRYRRLFETTGDGILILDAETGRIIDVNPLLEELLGYTGVNFIGKKLWDFGAFADIEASKASFMELQHEEHIRYEDLPLVTKDGRQIFVEFISNVYPAGGTKLIQCNIRDITDRKQAQEEIARLNIELEAFNYTVAHDLRKPLNVINGYCQAIKELSGDKLDEQCQRYLQETYNGTLRMNRLIDALLNFSRLAQIELQRETIDLGAMAKDVATVLKRADPERRGTFIIAIEPVPVDGDANLMRMVLDNLLGNAWKYSGSREEAIIEFGVMEINGEQACFVRDNGTGFDMADADKLFVPLKLLPGAEELRGFGIGLATVQRIIERHGGKVWAEGVPDRGATFYFTL